MLPIANPNALTNLGNPLPGGLARAFLRGKSWKPETLKAEMDSAKKPAGADRRCRANWNHEIHEIHEMAEDAMSML